MVICFLNVNLIIEFLPQLLHEKSIHGWIIQGSAVAIGFDCQPFGAGRDLDVDLHGATQTIAADLVDGPDATLLGVPSGSPVLRCRRVTTDRSGQPVLVSEHVFPAHRTEFVVDLPQAEPSMTPSGLRIVD